MFGKFVYHKDYWSNRMAI